MTQIVESISSSPSRPSTPSAQPPTIFPILRVVPLPISFTVGSTPILISPDLTIKLVDSRGVESSPPYDLNEAIARTKAHIFQTRHQYLSPTRGTEFFDEVRAGGSIAKLNNVTLQLTSHDADSQPLSIAQCAHVAVEDRPELEAYSLTISLDGKGVISSKSILGLLRGLTTFEQLVYHLPLRIGDKVVIGEKGGDGKLYAPFAPYEVHDRPAFGWRGLLLDTSRNWFSLHSIRKLLDTMCFVKLNVFHWHITDSNSWPLDLKKRPELAEMGAYSPSQKYSEDEIRDLIKYAAARGIDVLLEVDLPGHTASIHGSHPEHIACANARPSDKYANQPPAGQLRFATDSTVKWTKELMGDIVDAFGDDGGLYVGTGGDEVNVRCMMDDRITVASLKEKGWTLDEALDHFIGEVHRPIRAAGKTPVVWQEMALAHCPMPSLSKNALIHIWEKSGDAKKVLDTGFRIIHAPADHFYLDAGQGGWIATPHGSNSWCDPFKTWARMMSFDPYDCAKDDKSQAEIDVEKAKRVMGGQACLWTEQTDETNLECVVWPRAAAVADLFWTGEKAGGGYPRDATEALPRMHDVRYRMVDRGVRAVPLQPHWCALRPELSVQGA